MASLFIGTSLLIVTQIAGTFNQVAIRNVGITGIELAVLGLYSASLVLLWQSFETTEKLTIGDIFGPLDMAGICLETMTTSFTVFIGYAILTQRNIDFILAGVTVALSGLYLGGYGLLYQDRILHAYKALLRRHRE
ncbi:hypothetical protein [Salinibaculum rarum]|uniref:hypothetical protein n=1 Tax=Salinibaculum rarum TaxID=3058903 RepID=UPI00265E515C|nr:hypothetical protein [Salinibaculum sp. KK48]